MAPATISQSKLSLWGDSTYGSARVPVTSEPKASHQTALSIVSIGSGEIWRRATRVENIRSVEKTMEKAQGRPPWEVGALDAVSISAEDMGSDGSSTIDEGSLREKRGLLKRIGKRAGQGLEKLIVPREEKTREDEKVEKRETQNRKCKGRGTERDCATKTAVDECGILEEKSKYDKMEKWLRGITEATPTLKSRSNRNYKSLYGSNPANDRNIGDERRLKLGSGARRSISITTIG